VAFQSIVTSDVSQEIPIPVFLIRCVPEKGAMPQTPGAASSSPRRMVALAVDGRMPTSLLLAKYAARNIIAPTDDVQIVYKPVAGEEVPHAVSAVNYIAELLCSPLSRRFPCAWRRPRAPSGAAAL